MNTLIFLTETAPVLSTLLPIPIDIDPNSSGFLESTSCAPLSVRSCQAPGLVAVLFWFSTQQSSSTQQWTVTELLLTLRCGPRAGVDIGSRSVGGSSCTIRPTWQSWPSLRSTPTRTYCRSVLLCHWSSAPRHRQAGTQRARARTRRPPGRAIETPTSSLCGGGAD